MDTQLGARHRRRVPVNRNFAACHCEGASTKARRTCTLTTAPSTPGGPIRGCRRPRSRVPDRRDLLQSVHEPAAGFKSLVAVRLPEFRGHHT